MRLKLSYVTKSRLWVEIVHQRGEQVFVPTTQPVQPGETVPIEVDAPDLEGLLEVTGVVQRTQRLEGLSAAGVYVTLDHDSVERCRTAVGADTSETRTSGRTEVRAECDLSARVMSPRLIERCVVKSLSATGLTLRLPTATPLEGALSLVMTLSDGRDVALNAEVAWCRAELQLLGCTYSSQSAELKAQLHHAIEGLARPTPLSDRGTIVIADDDPSILEFASRVVTKAGFRVVQAARGDDALELVRTEHPVLVLLDVLMPGLDGLEVCAAIRRDVALAHLPVVLLSAMGADRLEEAARTVKAAWLTKPMRLEALRELVSKLAVARTHR